MFRIIFNPSIKIVFLNAVRRILDAKTAILDNFCSGFSIIARSHFKSYSANPHLWSWLGIFRIIFFNFSQYCDMGYFCHLPTNSHLGFQMLHELAKIMVMERSRCRGGGADWKYLNVLHLRLLCDVMHMRTLIDPLLYCRILINAVM